MTTGHGGRPPRILHVVEALGGGVLTAIVDYLTNTPELDHVVLGRAREAHATGEELGSVASDVLLAPDRPDRAILAVDRAYQQLQPDVVHTHSAYAGVWARCARIPTARLVYTPHCYPFERTDLPRPVRVAIYRTEKLLARRVGTVAAVGPREAALARLLDPGARVVVVPNIPRLPDDLRTVEPGPDDGLSVVGVGRLSAQKGPEVFAAVADAVRRVDPSVRFTWLGGTPPEGEARLRSHGVEVTGWVPRTEVLERLRHAQVYLHTAAWEGAPLTVLEAAHLGLPVVARAIPSLSALGLDRLASGPDDLARLVLALRDRDARSTAVASQRRWLDNHTPEAQRRQLLEVYEGVLAAGAVPSTHGGVR